MSESFEKFQTEEYSNISKAHFETNTQIATFFRYFLLIASAPAGIFIWYEKQENLFEKLFAGLISANTTLFIGFFLIFISIIGTLTCFYLISFRLDSVLYARTVNGIRKYFYEKEKIKNESHYRVLPTLTNQPNYAQVHTFSLVVWAIGIINALYFAIGTRIVSIAGDTLFSDYLSIHFRIINNYNIFWAGGFGVAFFIGHIVYYRFISDYRTFSYMKSLTIGIDIDGVLNQHRNTFCTFLYQNTKKTKTLWAEEVVEIPVNLIPDKGINRADESLVFNDPNYWIKQEPISNNIGAIIKELRNSFGYKIRIFSLRAWPEFTYYPLNKERCLKRWFLYGHRKSLVMKRLVRFLKIDNIIDKKFRYRTIHKITKDWLKRMGIPYDSLVIEKSGIDRKPSNTFLYSIFKMNFKSRYFYSKKDSYRYFVEDDVKNAIKLAANCEYVFLMDQPYNKNYDGRFVFPSNVIRVNSWSEIKEKIKELG